MWQYSAKCCGKTFISKKSLKPGDICPGCGKPFEGSYHPVEVIKPKPRPTGVYKGSIYLLALLSVGLSVWLGVEYIVSLFTVERVQTQSGTNWGAIIDSTLLVVWDFSRLMVSFLAQGLIIIGLIALIVMIINFFRKYITVPPVTNPPIAQTSFHKKKK